MTRSQVRAATRRMRDHVEEIEEEAGELNLVPYMDIVTNIIIFLLASVVNQVALGNINVSVPTISQGGGASDTFMAGIYGKYGIGPGYIAAAGTYTNYWMNTSRSSQPARRAAERTASPASIAASGSSP